MSEGVTLWRVSNYATLDGVGGTYVGGRWHTKGHPIIYCSEDPSTALLETLVHMEIDSEDRPQTFQVLKIQSSATLTVERMNVKKLSSDWPANLVLTKSIGDNWLQSRKSLLFDVPSVLIPERRNFLINPLHPEMKKLRITAHYSHPFDQRFFK
jgi:RES domain-containing protein